MKKWEYKKSDFGTAQAYMIVEVANRWAKENWRLISVCPSTESGRDYLTAFFEREIPEPPAEQPPFAVPGENFDLTDRAEE